jgi:hypothetical protein
VQELINNPEGREPMSPLQLQRMYDEANAGGRR